MLTRKELIRSREWWVAKIHLNLWRENGSIEEDSDKWEEMAEKVVDNQFMEIINEISNNS